MGYWEDKKEKLKKKFQFITEADLTFIEGKEKEMMEMLGHKLRKTKEEMNYIIDTL